MKKMFYVFAIATAALFIFGMMMASIHFDALWLITVFVVVGIFFLALIPSHLKEVYKERSKKEVEELLHNLKEEEKCMIQSAASYTNMKNFNSNVICKTIIETLDKE